MTSDGRVVVWRDGGRGSRKRHARYDDRRDDGVSRAYATSFDVMGGDYGVASQHPGGRPVKRVAMKGRDASLLQDVFYTNPDHKGKKPNYAVHDHEKSRRRESGELSAVEKKEIEQIQQEEDAELALQLQQEEIAKANPSSHVDAHVDTDAAIAVEETDEVYRRRRRR